MKKRILMLGAGFMQGVAIRCAKSRDWDVVAVDGNPGAPCAHLADRFEPVDLKDVKALVSLALSLKAEGGLDGVFTAATDFSASVAAVAESCGLPGHTLEAALNASDKVRMRACFERAGVPSPLYTGITGAVRPEALSVLGKKGIRFPLVVKPADNMGARGCRKVETAAALDDALADAIHYSRTGTAIVEEFMDGSEFSLEALVFDGEIHMTGFADRHIFFPPYFIEMGHTIPTVIPGESVAAVVDVFMRGVRALGLSSGVAKGDIKLTSRGPMVGEIAGRLSGGYMSGWTFPYSSGIDLTGAALDLAVGGRPGSLIPALNFTSAERAWISIPGIVASVSGLEEARAVPFVRDVFPRAREGDAVRFPVNNVEKCGNVLAVAPDRNQAINAAETAARSLFIRLVTSNPATDDFLRDGLRGSAFPPDAFVLPSGVIAACNDACAGNDFRTVSVPDLAVPVPDFLVPFLGTLKDWQGRTLAEAIAGFCSIEGTLVDELSDSPPGQKATLWKSFLRGGIQGIIYTHDSGKN